MFNSIGVCKGYTIVDRDKFEKLRVFSWRKDSVGYASTVVKGKPIRMHKFLIKSKKNFVTDHINRDRLDNRISNLRVITRKENNLNRLGIGVRRTKGGKWNARIRWDGKEKHLGNYDKFVDARKAYLTKKNELLSTINN